MRSPALPLIHAFLLASIFMSCQSPADAPVIKTGEDAAAAFDEWVSGDTFAQPLQYPVQVHIDYIVEMDMDLSSAGIPDPMEMDMTLNSDYIAFDANSLVIWGNMDMGANVEGEQHRLNFDFEVADDLNGMRLLLDDHGFFQDELGFDLPKAYSLSQDRLVKLVNMYGELIEEMGALYGESFTDIYSGVEGPGDLMHPANFMRFMANADVFHVIGWNAADGVVAIQATLDSSFMEGAFSSAALPFDSSIFDDMVFEIVADLNSGVMLDYAVEMQIPIEAPLTPGSDQVMQMDMGLKMRFTTVDVDPAAPMAVLPSSEEVMNLDGPFDQYMPLIQAALDMQRQQMRQMSSEGESGDDFDF
jgi:hypothetical protein